MLARRFEQIFQRSGMNFEEDVRRTGSEKKPLKPDTLSGRFSLDSGVLIEMLLGTSVGQPITQALLSDSITAYTSYLNLSETEYILCRRLGRELARSKVQSLVDSNYVTITDSERLYASAAEIKCERALSLADCYCLANAEVTKSKALFACREEDLTREIERKPFDVEIDFLEDISKPIHSRDESL
jgi:predicted nucleic acid-binding protein